MIAQRLAPGTAAVNVPLAPAGGPVVDLVALSSACRPVVAWYDDLRSGASPDIDALDRAIAGLRSLPEVGGRLGRAIRLVTAGGARDLDDTLAAIELLRHAALARVSIPSQPTRPTSRRRRYDVPLPGFEAESTSGQDC